MRRENAIALIGFLIIGGISIAITRWAQSFFTVVGLAAIMLTYFFIMLYLIPVNLPPPPLMLSPEQVIEVKVPKKTKKYSVTLPPPPSVPEVSDWAKLTVALMASVGKVWGELKLLVVGSVLLYLFIMPLPWDAPGIDYTAFQWIRFIALVLGSLAVWRWITNNARWEPKPIGGGRWVALVLVSIIVCSAVIIVFAIIYMPQLISLIQFLKGAQ